MSEHPPRSLLVKPVSGDCNLHCTYCFYRERSTDPYAGVPQQRMSARVLEEVIRQGLRLERRSAGFSWQGGEPTLAGLDFYRRVVALQQQHGYNGQAVSNALQTNGLLIDAEWARFLADYRFLVGLSLDGPAPHHNRYRTFADGSPTQERVVGALRLLQEHGVACNVLTVVNAVTAAHPVEIYDYLLDLGVRYMQFIPCVEVDPASGQVSPFSVSPEQYAEFLCALFDRRYNAGQPEASVRDLDAILALYLGQEPGQCSYQTRCGSYLVVEHNGDVYPCDFYVRADLRLGNLMETPLEALFESAAARAFAEAKARPRAECARCGWQPLCRQGCPRLVGVQGQPRDYFCRAYQRFYAHSRDHFMALRNSLAHERGIPVASLPSAPPTERNAPCPCGSGKKVKQCCGRRLDARA